jgi:hypothetical protein
MKPMGKKLQAVIDFIDAIDECFSFDNEEVARAIVSRGAEMSDNAALMVGYELASEPPGQYGSVRLSLLEQLLRERPTEAVKAAAPVIESLIKDATPPERAVRLLLDYCRENKGSYNALNILSLCSEKFEKEADNVRAAW